MSKTADIVSRIVITFNDGSVIELVDSARFLAIRDGLAIASKVNNQLNEQLKILENKISELEAENKTLDEKLQSEVGLEFYTLAKNIEFKKPVV